LLQFTFIIAFTWS